MTLYMLNTYIKVVLHITLDRKGKRERTSFPTIRSTSPPQHLICSTQSNVTGAACFCYWRYRSWTRTRLSWRLRLRSHSPKNQLRCPPTSERRYPGRRNAAWNTSVQTFPRKENRYVTSRPNMGQMADPFQPRSRSPCSRAGARRVSCLASQRLSLSLLRKAFITNVALLPK